MAKKQNMQSGGINITGSTINVGGDIVGGDKITSQSHNISQSISIEQHFEHIYNMIDNRAADPDVDKDELMDTVTKIEDEVKKGEQANPQKVERWLRSLAVMADDIFQVVAATLVHPMSGVGKIIQIIARRAKETGN